MFFEGEDHLSLTEPPEIERMIDPVDNQTVEIRGLRHLQCHPATVGGFRAVAGGSVPVRTAPAYKRLVIRTQDGGHEQHQADLCRS